MLIVLPTVVAVGGDGGGEVVVVGLARCHHVYGSQEVRWEEIVGRGQSHQGCLCHTKKNKKTKNGGENKS